MKIKTNISEYYIMFANIVIVTVINYKLMILNYTPTQLKQIVTFTCMLCVVVLFIRVLIAR